MEKLRVCFAGTPAFAAAHLQRLVHTEHQLVAVYCQPDRPSGRGKKLQAGPVKTVALQNSIPVLQPVSLKSPEEEQALRDLDIDALIVVAYGLILPQSILNIPKYGCINVHASLLPRWRGAAPIERAILAGDKVTGVTIMQMDAGLDTGDMLNKAEVSIEDSDTRIDIEDKLITAGSEALIATLDNLQHFRQGAESQNDANTCYAAKLEKSESLINWQLSAIEIDRLVRAVAGRTPAFTFFMGDRLRIMSTNVLSANMLSSSTDIKVSPGTITNSCKDSFTVKTGDGLLEITTVQLPGKTSLKVRDVLNSRPDLFSSGLSFSSSGDI